MNEPIEFIITDTALQYGVPSRATEGAAGYDLKADISAPITILPESTATISTGVSFYIKSRHCAGYVFPRSGLAHKFSVTLQNAVGLIDSDYQGEVFILLRNEGLDPYRVNPGDRIAQIVFAPVIHPMLASVQAFSSTPRGTKGLGSTGVETKALASQNPGITPSLAGNPTPTQLLGNDLPIEAGQPLPITYLTEPTGLELLEKRYGAV